jgi:hypothetical protein
VVGKSQPVQLYELIEKTEAATETQQEKVTVFHQALDLFIGRQWLKAREGFHQVLSLDPDDGPAPFYIKRCDTYAATPPADNWEGVFNLTEK